MYIFGLRLNMYIATVLAVIGAVWFYRSQRRPAAALVAAAPAGAPAGDAGAGRVGDAGAGAGRPMTPGPGALLDDASAEEGPRESRDSEQATSEP